MFCDERHVDVRCVYDVLVQESGRLQWVKADLAKSAVLKTENEYFLYE